MRTDVGLVQCCETLLVKVLESTLITLSFPMALLGAAALCLVDLVSSEMITPRSFFSVSCGMVSSPSLYPTPGLVLPMCILLHLLALNLSVIQCVHFKSSLMYGS